MVSKRIGFLDRFKSLDVFTKPLEDFQEKTLYGGLVTIICWIAIWVLILNECREYMKTSWKEEIFVDVSSGGKLQINMDIIVHRISCKYLSIDATDVTGEQHLHIDYNIFKRRLDLDGFPIEDPQKDVLKPANTSVNSTICGSCYGAETNETMCCNTCDEVRQAYFHRKWTFNRADIEQCKIELKGDNEAVMNEGCQMFGTMEVNRVEGSFHIAPGQSYSVDRIHIHDIKPFASKSFNTTHTIRHMSFGRKILPSDEVQVATLDGFVGKTDQGSAMFHYYLKLIPTILVKNNAYILNTNQYSVTKFDKPVQEGGMPGIFFSYELSPLMVKRTEEYKSLGHLVTTLLSYISGVYICALLIDSFLHKMVKYVTKIEIGKQN